MPVPMTLPAPVRDVAVLLARIGVGVVFVAHGWQKLFTNGIDGTAAFFDQAGIPAPTLSAWVATIIELIGGAALILGLLVPVAAVLLLLDMLGAWLFVHAGHGFFLATGGCEYVLTLGSAALLFAAVGGGRYSLDHVLFDRRRKGVVHA
jgi:putative oxidoreductase